MVTGKNPWRPSHWRLGLLMSVAVCVALVAGVASATFAQASTGYRIHGQVKTDEGKPLAGVTVVFSGGLPPQVTDDGGAYQVQTGADACAYTVTPSKEGYEFRPSQARVWISLADAEVNFTGMASAPSVKGESSVSASNAAETKPGPGGGIAASDIGKPNASRDPSAIVGKVCVDNGAHHDSRMAKLATRVATPTFSPGQGTFVEIVTVRLSCATPEASIRYTTDGTDPTSTSPQYDGKPLVLAEEATLKARAFKSGMQESAVAKALYAVARRRVVRYDSVAISGAAVRTTTGKAASTDKDGYFTVDGTVKTITKTGWWVRQQDSTTFQGAYLKSVFCQQLGISVYTLADALSGTTLKWLTTLLKAIVDVKLGVKAMQDLDDVSSKTDDGKSRYVTGWARGYVEVSVGNAGKDLFEKLTGISASISKAGMVSKHPNHDPALGWSSKPEVEVALFDNVFAMDVSATTVATRQSFRSGQIVGNLGLSTTLLSFSAINGTLQTPASCEEYKSFGGSNVTALGIMIVRLGTVNSTGPLGRLALGKVGQWLGLWRKPTGAGESEQNNWRPIP